MSILPLVATEDLEFLCDFLPASDRPTVEINGKPEVVLRKAGLVWLALHSRREELSPIREWALEVLTSVVQTGAYIPTAPAPEAVAKLNEFLVWFDSQKGQPS